MEISEFWKEYKEGILRYLPLGILDGVVLFYAYYLLSLANNFTDSGQRSIVVGIGIGVLIIGICLGAWSFILTSMVDLPRRHILKNAVILMIAEWKRSLLLAAITILHLGMSLALVPWSIIWLIVIGISFQQLCMCAVLIPAVKKRIIEPYESKKPS